MEYMILIHSDETAMAAGAPAPGTTEFEQMMGQWIAYNQRLIDGGHWIDGGMLQSTATATTLRKTGPAAPAVTDGPFAETKEQLGGYYLITAADLDEALELATGVPMPFGSIEVRPLAMPRTIVG